jgi:dihydrofolate reductase
MEMKPTINLIAAVAEDGAIGKNNQLLWKIKADLAYYKARTYGNVLVMGEATYETLPKVALRGRTTVVVSEKYCEKLPFTPEEAESDLVLFTSNPTLALNSAKILAKERKCDVYIVGGASIYEQLMRECEFAFITWVQKNYPDADKHFPIQEFLSIFGLISESGWQDEEGLDVREDQLDEPNYKFTVYKNNLL